jgi:hypothetical protein
MSTLCTRNSSARLVAAIGLGLLILGSASLADADDAKTRRFTPTVGLEMGRYDEVLRLDLQNGESSEQRAIWNTRVSFGLAIRLAPSWLRVGKIDLQSSIGFGYVYLPGHFPLHLRQGALWKWSPSSWFSLFAGGSLGVSLDTGDATFSYLEFGIPMGVRLWFVELVYRPAATIGLGRHHRTVFSGERAHGVATSFQPFQLALRFRLSPLSW